MTDLPDFTAYSLDELRDVEQDRIASLTWRIAARDEIQRREAAPFGLEIERGDFHPRSLIGAVELTPAGNVALRVGRENAGAVQSAAHPAGWHQTEHVVMPPDEARRFAHAILAAIR